MNKRKRLFRVVSSFCAASMIAAFLGTSQVSAATVRKAGDVDGDGSVTSADSLLVTRYSVGLEKFNDTAKKAADVDFNGTIDSADALIIQRASVGLNKISPLVGTTWTSLGQGSNKIVFKGSIATSRVTLGSVPSWIKLTYSISNGYYKSVTLTTSKNASTSARKTTFRMTVDGNVYSMSIKQMPTPATAGWDACYTYAMQLNTDPRVNVVMPFDYNSNPGTPGRISGKADLSKYKIDQFNVINNTLNLTSFEDYTLKYVKADLATLGWGIKKASNGATSSVKSGDWLVCLVFNPSETHKTSEEMSCILRSELSPPTVHALVNHINSKDYHWYRRSGSAGNYTWSHKRGTNTVLTLAKNKTPENYDAKTNPISLTSVASYKNDMKDYVKHYEEQKKNPTDAAKYGVNPREFGVGFVSFYQPKDDTTVSYASTDYFLVGYYEVGPNAF